MPANWIRTQQPTAQDGEPQCLTVNVVMPAVGDTGKETASFTGLLVALTTLAFERFGAAQEHPSPDALRELVPPCLAGIPVDPFDGQLLRFRKAESGYQLQNAAHDVTFGQGGEHDLVLQGVES